VINGSIPGCDSRSWLKSSAIFLQLPQLQKTVRELQAKIGVLESRPETL
jgi:hypothetical protein